MSDQRPSASEILKAEQILPMWKIVWLQFKEHKMALVALFLIVIFILIAVFAPLIKMVTGLDPENQNPLNRYQPMLSRVEAPSSEREVLFQKYLEQHGDEWQTVAQSFFDRGFITSSESGIALNEIIGKPTDEINEALAAGAPAPAFQKMLERFRNFHIFGTDELGRDAFIRLVYGTRVSIGIGVLVALFAALIGIMIGSLAGFYGGFIDMALMRVTDALLSLPTIPVLIVVAAVDMAKIPLMREMVGSQNQSIVKMIFIICLFSWMQVALLVRANVLSLREREFILATKTLGARDRTVIFRHLFPNVIAPMLVSVTLGIGSSILYESVLSFLGLGVQPPTPTWGNMLFNAQELISEAPALAIIPGLLILLIIVSFNYLGDGLQDAIDPKAIRR